MGRMRRQLANTKERMRKMGLIKEDTVFDKVNRFMPEFGVLDNTDNAYEALKNLDDAAKDQEARRREEAALLNEESGDYF